MKKKIFPIAVRYSFYYNNKKIITETGVRRKFWS